MGNLKLFVFAGIILNLSACSHKNSASLNTPNLERKVSSIKDGPEREILAETTNPDNISLNGKSYDHCVLFLEDGVTKFDEKRAKFVRLGIGKKGERLEVIDLFRIEENGDYVKR